MRILYSFFSIISVFAFNIKLHAESSYTPMLKEWNTWYYHFMIEFPDDVMDEWFIYDIPSSFIKEGKTYYKMRFFVSPFLVNSRTKNTIPRSKNTIPSLDLREECGRVYIDLEQYIVFLIDNENNVIPGEKVNLPYHVTEDNEIVLYDFNMEVGDKYVHVDGCDDIFVVKTDSIVTQDSKRRKRIILNNGLTIVEGIGCVNSAGGLLNYLNPVRHGDEEHIAVQSGNMEDFQALDESYPYNKRVAVEIIPEIVKTDMPSINRQWTIASPERSGDDGMIKLSECTLKEGIYIDLAHFMKVYSREYSLDQPEPEWSKTDFYVGQSGDKVYCYISSFDEPRLLMDFSLTEGESTVCYRGEGCYVEYVVEAVTDTVMPESTDQFRRKCLRVRNTAEPTDTDVWVEGIGSMKYGIACWNAIGRSSLSALASCRQGELVLMEDSTKMKSPILSGIESSQATKDSYRDNMNTESPDEIFLPSGQKVKTDTPSKGLRIIRYSDGTVKKVYTR